MDALPNPPSKIVVGDSYTFYHNQGQYITDGYTIKFTIRGLSELDVISTTDTITLSSAQTSLLVEGMHQASLIAFLGSSRTVISTSQIEILADPTATSLVERLTHNQRMLAAIEAHIEGRATDNQLDHIRATIRTNDSEHTLERLSLADLITIRNTYKRAVAIELGRFPKGVAYTFK